MQLLSRGNRRPPNHPKRIASGEFPQDNDREALLRLINWFRQRRLAHRATEQNDLPTEPGMNRITALYE